MSQVLLLAACLVLAAAAASDNSTSTDTCALDPATGPWSAALQDWVTSDHGTNNRHGRIMALPPSQGYYVSDRIDLVPPPPPMHHGHHMLHRGPYPAHPGPPSHPPPPSYSGPPPSYSSAPQNSGPHHASPNTHSSQLQNPPSPPPSGPPQQGPVSERVSYDEWQATPPPPPGAGKIVNKPPNPYKDQFKPSYPPPSPPQQQQIPVHGLSDRVDEARPPPPHKQVSETDLYLLGAIEKLVYRVDIMEKRLRKMEENMHLLVVGTGGPRPEPCKANFTRVGERCYHLSSEALNWKNANYACRKLQGHLLELVGDQRKPFTAGLLADKNFKGYDFWTGGLNPGLLWIWSHSAAAVANTTVGAEDPTIVGEGRCLALIHDPAVNTYVYRGQDCALRHRYVCQKNADKMKLSNEIERAARALHMRKRTARINWSADDNN